MRHLKKALLASGKKYRTYDPRRFIQGIDLFAEMDLG
jgi:hypothetical protein